MYPAVTLLIVEDTPTISEWLGNGLGEEGYVCGTVATKGKKLARWHRDDWHARLIAN